jgi:transcriptional regulator with XRE-family HTH domain
MMAKNTLLKNRSFAERVISLRKQNSLTASDLAKLANVSPAAVWSWEKNGITPRPATLKTIASKLDVSAEYLLNGGEAETALVFLNDKEVARASIAPLAHLENAPLEDLIREIEQRGFYITVQSRR